MTIKPKVLALSFFFLLGGLYPGDAALISGDKVKNKEIISQAIISQEKISTEEVNNLPNVIDTKIITAKKSQNSDVTSSKILHTINRLSFGVSPGDIDKVKEIGIKRYVKQQLSPESIPEPQILTSQLQQLKTSNLKVVTIYQRYKPKRSKKLTKEERKALNKSSRKIKSEATKARLLRAVHSDRQLQEVMVDFWYNHFNVHGGKGDTRLLVGTYERDAIRPHVFGRFRDLLGATARHPAMLIYLDNKQNTAPNSPGARGRRKGLNENYARELMELHTLGVNGGYTQEDVINLARIFTGWGISRDPKKTQNGSGFYFSSRRHDFSDKIFLGKNIMGGGEDEGKQALDILATHPATARHISYKLAQYFVADKPPESLVKRLSKKFIKTDGNIKAVLYTLFDSPEFWDTKHFNTKFKTPLQYLVSVIRATDMKVRDTRKMNGFLGQSGMHLYGCRFPDGYKNTQDAWLNPDAMSRRLSFVTHLGNGGYASLEKTKNQPKNKNKKSRSRKTIDADKLANTLGDYFSSQTQSAIASSPPGLHAAMMLGSPEFMRR
ncbi:MAG: DUF1800 domain-containing protein [Cyanobacteria bacterium P01_A01_bin.84]